MTFDLESHLIRQRDFSLKTFGPGARTVGICNHIRKELLEIEARPDDIMEWADVLILAFDGALRAGFAPGELQDIINRQPAVDDILDRIRAWLSLIESGHPAEWLYVIELALLGAEKLGWPWEAFLYAMLAKQIKNESRQWPDWRSIPEDVAIEHIRNTIIVTPNDESLTKFIAAGGDAAEYERTCQEAAEHAIAARIAGDATVTDRFPDSETPRIDVRALATATTASGINAKLRAMWARYKAIKSGAEMPQTDD